MSNLLHRLGHLAIIVVTFVALYGGYVPGKYAAIAIAAQGLAQAILAELKLKPLPTTSGS